MLIDKLLYLYNNHEANPRNRKLSEFFLKQRTNIEFCSLGFVEVETGISKSGITRFCNEMNCDNYTIFKFEFLDSLKRKYRIRDKTLKDVDETLSKALAHALTDKQDLIVIGDAADFLMFQAYARRLYMAGVLVRYVNVMYEENLPDDEGCVYLYCSSQYPLSRYHDQTLKNKASKFVYDMLIKTDGFKIYPSDRELNSNNEFKLDNGDVYANQRRIHRLIQSLCHYLET